MPSVSVPLKTDTARWAALMKTRRDWWAKENRNQLTKNFKATEFYTHDGSAVPTAARPALVKLCEVYLEPMRTKFGTCFVTSGYRHVLYNAMIGGAKQSQHIYEYGFESVAADVHFARGTPAQWAAYARGLRTKAGGNGGVGRYDRAGFMHVDNRLYRMDWQG